MSWKISFFNQKVERDSHSPFFRQEDTENAQASTNIGSEETEGAEVMTRPDFKSFKDKALKRSRVKKAYNELAPAYQLRRKLVSIRKEAGLTQEQVAEILHTSKSNISRLESLSSDISPKLSTITDYAAAVGYEVKIDFVPMK